MLLICFVLFELLELIFKLLFHSEWLAAASEEAGAVDGDVAPSDCASLSKPFQEMHFTPRKNAHTPMKTLPFSPSQVCPQIRTSFLFQLFIFHFSPSVLEQLIVNHLN